MATQPNSAPMGSDTQKATLAKRLDDLGWGLFLIMTGGIWLVPPDRIPPGTWLIGTGLLLLTLNIIRYLNRMAISTFTSVLGALALAGGLADLAGIELPLFAIGLIIVGASVILKPLLTQRA